MILPTLSQFAERFTKISINDAYSHPDDVVPLPRSHADPIGGAPFFKLFPEVFVYPHPINNTCHKSREHPIQDDLSKRTMILTCEQTINSEIQRKNRTNQNFSPRPSNSDIYPIDCKHKSLPNSLNKLIAPTKLKHIHKGKHLSQHSELRIDVAGGIWN